jgi:hypothetical protein
MKTPRWAWLLANGLGGAALVLLAIDPTRLLWPVVLLVVAVASVHVCRFWRPREEARRPGTVSLSADRDPCR